MVYIRGTVEVMERVGVRDLKQNASKVVADVERSGAVLVTVHGRDAVVMVPLGEQPRWVRSGEARRFWEVLDADIVWARELEQQRASDLVTDPWE